MELRGLGVINIKDLFGIASTRSSKRVELVVQLERWDPTREYERLGLDDEFYEILGLRVPLIRMPVAPGRNIAILVEVAARNQLLRAARPSRRARSRRRGSRRRCARRARWPRRRTKTTRTMTRRTPSDGDRRVKRRRKAPSGAARSAAGRTRPAAVHRPDRPVRLGKSQAIRALEDLGYFCVDNLPTTLIPTLAKLSLRAGGDIEKVAIVVDVREGGLPVVVPEDLRAAAQDAAAQPGADLPRGEPRGAGAALQRDAAAASAGAGSLGRARDPRRARAAERRSASWPTRSSTPRT